MLVLPRPARAGGLRLCVGHARDPFGVPLALEEEPRQFRALRANREVRWRISRRQVRQRRRIHRLGANRINPALSRDHQRLHHLNRLAAHSHRPASAKREGHGQ